MNSPKFLQQVLGVLLVVVFLAGCAAPAAAPTAPPTFPPPPPPPPTFPPPPTPAQPTPPTGQPSLFTLVKSVQVTPSGNYLNADFARIAYVPGRDRFVVTFGTNLSQREGGCPTLLPKGTIPAYVYKEYTSDMVETGNAGVISCNAITDTGGLFVGNDFYLASGGERSGVGGWLLAKFNAVTWANSGETWYPVTDAKMQGGDPMVAYVNGQVDISSVYMDNGKPPIGTHHHFFTADLQFVNSRILSDTQHFGFSSMITEGGIIYIVSSTDAPGPLIVMEYDTSWKYLGMKTLREHAATPQGLAFDGTRFYVAYTDQQRTESTIRENVHLAAFDTSWNLVDDVALTNYALDDQISSIHPSLAVKDNRLYVAYAQPTAGGGVDTLQAYVKVYELTQKP